MRFVGHTRFSLYQPGATAWHASNRSKFRTPAEYRAYLYSPERLDARMDIFLSMTLPQLATAARDWDVTHVVSYSESLPSAYRAELEAAASIHPWLVLDRCPLGKAPLDPIALAPAGMIGAYRLDDDDVLPVDYFARMAPYVTQQHAGMFVSLAAGFTAIYRDGGLYFTRQAYVPMIALGFLSIHHRSADGTLISPPPAAHNLSDRAAPVILDSREPGYLWVRHPDQDTNVHAADLPRETRLRNLMTRMEERPPVTDRAAIRRHFPHIAERIHAGSGPGETFQAPVTSAVSIPPEGLPMTIEPVSGSVTITVRLRPGPNAVSRNALLGLALTDLEGNPVGEDRAAGLREAGLSYSRAVGYYRYLGTERGRLTTTLSFTLPSDVLLTALTARKWHRPETDIKILELSLTCTR